jgi:hypothetical protein
MLKNQQDSIDVGSVALPNLRNDLSNRADKGWLKDGNTTGFAGGVDGSRPSSDISRDQVAFATNTTFRGGPAQPRPGFKSIALNFASNVQSPFESPAGPFQHASFFDGAGVPSLMSSHGGRQFMINLNDFSVQEITPFKSDGTTPNPNSPVLDIGWSENVENYWVYQDNQSYPIIFNGSNSVRSNPAKQQVPVGNVMCYTQGRLAVALPDRQSFRIGDLVFSASGTPSLSYRDAPLFFTENSYYNEGGDFLARVFGAPSNSGPILSMKAGAMTDTSLGQGPLLVGTPYMVFSVNLPFDRTIWKNMQQPIQTANPIYGPMGQDSTILVNTDLWYRGVDGIRSYVTAQRQFNGSWGNTPLSSEISETLSYDTETLLEHGSGVVFNNRILMTVSPVRTPYGIWHRGLAVLDLDLISTLRGKSNPCWEGIWSGLRILKIVKAMVDFRERCFIYALDDDNLIVLWELTTDAKFDDDTVPINWAMELPSYNCGDSDAFKRLETGRIIVTNLVGTLSGTVKYRTDESPCWQSWTSINVCSKYKDCGPGPCSGPHTYREQERTPVKLNMPPDSFETTGTMRKYRTGYEFQPRLELTGFASIRQFRLYCLPESESLSPEPYQK